MGNGIISGEEPYALLYGDPIKGWIYDGTLHLYLIVRDSDGTTIATVDGNVFHINPIRAKDFNYDHSCLEVKNNSGDVVLQIEMLEDAVRIYGNFYNKNGIVSFSNQGMIQAKFVKIDPIFVYPGKNNQGVRIS